jgi:predicted transcriptional regulator of viral defense system
MAVVDLRSASWRRARAEVVPPGYAPDECPRRLARAGRLRRVGRGLYVVVDPVRETPAIAIASALFAEVPYYVTTDAALAFHGLIDQPIRTIAVVLSSTRRAIDIGRAVVRPVTVSADRLRAADAYTTTADGFAVRLASP